MRKLVIRYLWKAHAVAVIILVAFGSLSVSGWAFRELDLQRYVVSEGCIDNATTYAEAERCPANVDKAKEWALLIFLLMAIPAGIRFTRWKEKETYRKECEARIRNGIITPEEFYWSVAEYRNEVEQPPIPPLVPKDPRGE